MTGKIRKLLLKGRKGIKRCKKYGANYYRKKPYKPQFLAGKWPDAEGTLNGGKN